MQREKVVKNKMLGRSRSYHDDAEDKRRLNNDFIFYESRDALKSLSLAKLSKLVMGQIVRCGSRSAHNSEFGHFTLLFCRGWQEMYKQL